MERTIRIESVKSFETRGGNVRYVVRDDDGNEYTTFREAIGGRARELEGRQARIEFHEETRGQYQNVYLDKVDALPEVAGAREGEDSDPDEAAWRTAVEAAPWLLGEADPHAKTSPEDLYETLKPFKDRVAEDIKDADDAASDADDAG